MTFQIVKSLLEAFNEMVREERNIKKTLQQSVPKIKNMSYKAVEYLKELG